MAPRESSAHAHEPVMRQRYEYGKNWFYSLEEIKAVYEKEYNSEKRELRNVVLKRGAEWIGTRDGEEFVVPQEFIDHTLTHFKDMLEQGAARFLFRLDAFHGHFFVPEQVFTERYAALSPSESARSAFTDKDLGVLYHNFEHLKAEDNATKALYKKRNVVGWYDSRPIEVLLLPAITNFQKQTNAANPDGTHLINPPFVFAAYKDGAFSIIVDNKEIKLDLSFDDDVYW